MSALSTLPRTERARPSAAGIAAAAPNSEAVAELKPCTGGRCAALEEQNKKLIAQMERMQQENDELKRQAQETAARPSDGASAIAVLQPAKAAALCTLRQQSASPLPTQLPIGQRLHKDALHCVLAYLYLTELPAAMRSCRAWYAAVRSLPLQNVLLYVCSARRLYRLPLSASTPLARHIVTCNVRNAGIPISADDLAQFLTCLPRLQSLSHSVCRSLNLHPQLYSSLLRELNVDLSIDGRDDGGDGGDDASAMQMANLSSATGLHRLTISCSPSFHRHISLASLEGMLELEFLTLHKSHNVPWQQFVHIRRLPSLRTLSIDSLDDYQAEMLVEERAECPPLQLHAFEGLSTLDLETAQVLLRMPTLRRVMPCSLTSDALQLLAHGIPDLHTLKIDIKPREVDGFVLYDWSLVCNSLAACRQLTALTLVATPLEEFAALFLALPPSVRKIGIHRCAGFLQSDAFFQGVTEGGLRQLEQLHIWLELDEVDEFNSAINAAWLTRQRACAPWINAVLR